MIQTPHRLFVLTAIAAALAFSSPVPAQPGVGLDSRPAVVERAANGRPLFALASAAPADVAVGYLRARGRSPAQLASLRLARDDAGAHGVRHIRFEQVVDGLSVYGAYFKGAVNARGELVHAVDRLAAVSEPAAARVDALTALRAAMARVHPGQPTSFRLRGTEGNVSTFDGGAFFHESPAVTAVAVPRADGSLARGWLVETWTQRSNLLDETLVDGDGNVLAVERRTANDSYYVFLEDPGKAAQTVVDGPAPSIPAPGVPSPAGWLGTGPQTTINIAGNNANAYLDVFSNNRPDAGGTAVTTGNFLTAADLAVSPTTEGNRAVAVQNLFYLNNVVHDILYGYGFDEGAGNFQLDNFGRGGAANDPVLAEAHDGGGSDNANFATPRDGRKPRMQMYLWTGAGTTHEVVVAAVSYGALGAQFGPALTTTGVTGNMAVTTPADGCTAISTPLAGKLALIDRGSCDFSVKVLNAQLAGAVGAIIANNVGTDEVFVMGPGANARRVRIPSVMVGKSDGITLKQAGGVVATERRKAVQPLQLDASLDADIVFHEYGHGLSWRMVGGMSGPLAGALGEGTSDVIAMLINGDDTIAEYSAANASGIRRFRYEAYPLTYKDVKGESVHNDGEIYAAVVWRLMGMFGEARRADLFRYVVDGMNYTPSTPTYEQMRDGILASVANGPAPADCTTVWAAFAQSGIGVGALGTVSRTGIVTIAESMAVPATCP